MTGHVTGTGAVVVVGDVKKCQNDNSWEMLKCNPWDMPSNFTVYDCLSYQVLMLITGTC